MSANRPTSGPRPSLTTGVPYGPGKLSVPEANAAGVTARYELGDRQADRAFNGDGLSLSAEARVRAGRDGAANLERVRLGVGVEGVEARVRVVKDGEGTLAFDGLKLRDGYVKGKLEDGREWLEARPLAATAAVVGAVVIAHEVAKQTGPIELDTGGIELYEKDGLSASVTGYLAITGDDRWIDPRGAKAELRYTDAEVGTVAVEARYDREDGTRATARWNKRFKSGLDAAAEAFYEEKTRDAGVRVGLSYRF